LRGYERSDFGDDLVAGTAVAFIALPPALAFGIASGATPSQGLVTAIVGGFLVSLLGGSRVQIAGPPVLSSPCSMPSSNAMASRIC
jgi:SulP family sulfate permease